jgi:molybdopterin-binding protein
MLLSARNQLKGDVKAIKKGAVNNEVVIGLPGGTQITAVITQGACASLKLKKGKTAYAIVKASNVMVGVDE